VTQVPIQRRAGQLGSLRRDSPQSQVQARSSTASGARRPRLLKAGICCYAAGTRAALPHLVDSAVQWPCMHIGPSGNIAAARTCIRTRASLPPSLGASRPKGTLMTSTGYFALDRAHLPLLTVEAVVDLAAALHEHAYDADPNKIPEAYNVALHLVKPAT
jgi:hypothetical protein